MIDMKRGLFITMLMALFTFSAHAQQLSEGEMPVVYHMPLTQLAITIQYDEIQMTPGPFYQYAERYLGAKDVILEPQTRYEITQISLDPHTVADPNRSYKVLAHDAAEHQWLTLTSQGLLYGYNVPGCAEQPAQTLRLDLPSAAHTSLMPLLEEQMVASSTAKMAEGAAKMIYSIRETRLHLLGGDVEHMPADGQAMLLVLQQLDEREKMLTELFIGSTRVLHHSHVCYYTPGKDVQQHVVTRFSRFAGIVPADDLSGEPIRLTIQGHRKSLEPAADWSQESTSKKGKINLPSQIYYNLPGSAQITLTWAKQQLTTQLPIAQYGVAVPLALNLLNAKQTPKIYFNTATGNILSIQQ